MPLALKLTRKDCSRMQRILKRGYCIPLPGARIQHNQVPLLPRMLWSQHLRQQLNDLGRGGVVTPDGQ